jgi:hypothetical protein
MRPHEAGLMPFFTGNWGAYAQNPDTSKHIFNYLAIAIVILATIFIELNYLFPRLQYSTYLHPI